MPFFMPGKGNPRHRKSAEQAQSELTNDRRDTLCTERIDITEDASGGDLSDHEPLLLEDAARRLDLSEDEVKKRFRTGEVRGFVQDDHLFIYVPEDVPRAASGEGFDARTIPEKDRNDPATVIAYQKIEINRLIRANGELKTEKERLYRLLEREQVLRQGMQRAMERAWERLAVAQGSEPLADSDERAGPAEAA